MSRVLTESCLLAPRRASTLYREQGSPCQLRKCRHPRKAEERPRGIRKSGRSLNVEPGKGKGGKRRGRIMLGWNPPTKFSCDYLSFALANGKGDESGQHRGLLDVAADSHPPTGVRAEWCGLDDYSSTSDLTIREKLLPFGNIPVRWYVINLKATCRALSSSIRKMFSESSLSYTSLTMATSFGLSSLPWKNKQA